MFNCIECSGRFTLDDVKEGKYFPSTSTCLGCYKRMKKSKVRCFGKETMHNIRNIPCQQCPDERMCRVAINHRLEI